ncbi:MAG: hypothetical protein WBO29_15750 [Albidovulum sp.]
MAMLVALPFARNYYCATNRRLLSLHFAPWRRTKFSSVERADAVLQAATRRPLIVRDAKTQKRVMTMILSKKDEESLLSFTKQDRP